MKFKITLKTPIILDEEIDDDTWYGASKESKNIFMKEHIEDYLECNLEDMIENNELIYKIINE